jgi:DNA-directed RNA polymerase subunit RPC12/RpoP
MAEPPIVVTYKGVRYKRNPSAKQRSHRVYYAAPRGSGADTLHRDIWRDAHPGEDIPKGWHIHHDDHDPFNNDPGNLVLRSPKGHAAEHPEVSGMPDGHLAAIRPLADEWHRSQEGRAWHREHGKRTWEGREPQYRKTCAECGAEFLGTWNERGRYCSRRCINRAAERRLRRAAVCVICGSEYEHDRKSRGQTCSRKCGAALRKQRAA